MSKNLYVGNLSYDTTEDTLRTLFSEFGDIESVNASGGFIRHHEQYEELFQGKHVVIDCVICHDPHEGVVQLRMDEELPNTRTQCENCHLEQAQFQDSMRINPVQIEQFNEDGSASLSEIGLNFACRHCHGVTASEKSDEELIEKAVDYHTPSE